MPGILDVCVPSRRRERRQQRHEKEKEKLHTRWGDVAISAPNEGGWNQVGGLREPVNAWDIQSTKGFGSPDTAKTLVNSSPELEQESDETVLNDEPEDTPLEKASITITIPLPWTTKRTHSRSSITRQSVQVDGSKKEALREVVDKAPTNRPQSPGPPIYTPISGSYMQDLANMSIHKSPNIGPWNHSEGMSPPSLPIDASRLHTVPPSKALSPVSEDFAKDVTDNGTVLGPDPPVNASSSPAQPHVSPPLPRPEQRPRSRSRPPSGPLPPLPFQAPLESTSSTPVQGWTERPPVLPNRRYSYERPSLALLDRPSTAMSTHSQQLPPTSVIRARSASRGPSDDPIATARARSSSRGPGLDRTGYMRSTSHEATQYRAASRDSFRPGGRATSRESINRRTSSRGPVPGSRASSRGPTHERAPSRGPALGSRAASREPTYQRNTSRPLASGNRATSREPNYERASSRGPALSSHPPSRTASVGPTHHRPSPQVDPSSSDSCTDDTDADESEWDFGKPSTTTTNTTIVSPSSSDGTGGYYAQVKQDYTHVAKEIDHCTHVPHAYERVVKDVDLFGDLSESEREEMRKGEFVKKPSKPAQDKSPLLAQEMVPSGDELWS